MMLFGRSWGAPVCEDATWLPETPTYARCSRCHHLFEPGEQGYVLPTFGEVDPDYLIGLTGPDSRGQAGTLTGVHRECQLLGTVGHVFGVCSCTGWDPESREAGLELLRRVEGEELPAFRQAAEDAEAAVIEDAARRYYESRST